MYAIDILVDAESIMITCAIYPIKRIQTNFQIKQSYAK